MSILCNALQPEVQCRMTGPDGMCFPQAMQSNAGPQPGDAFFSVSDALSQEKWLETAQVFRLAASIAARLTSRSISLACRAGERV
jgi:hypothetical protein